jgi:hypothetical protein
MHADPELTRSISSNARELAPFIKCPLKRILDVTCVL